MTEALFPVERRSGGNQIPERRSKLKRPAPSVSGRRFCLQLTSDSPACPSDALRAEYGGMAAQIDLIAERARIAPSLSFYAENLESAGAGMS